MLAWFIPDKLGPKTTSEDRFPGAFRQLHLTPLPNLTNFTLQPSIMAPIQSQPSKLFAGDIIRYSDPELDQYLGGNGRSGLFEPYDLQSC
jgi:hypothetical protein